MALFDFFKKKNNEQQINSENVNSPIETSTVGVEEQNVEQNINASSPLEGTGIVESPVMDTPVMDSPQPIEQNLEGIVQGFNAVDVNTPVIDNQPTVENQPIMNNQVFTESQPEINPVDTNNEFVSPTDIQPTVAVEPINAETVTPTNDMVIEQVVTSIDNPTPEISETVSNTELSNNDDSDPDGSKFCPNCGNMESGDTIICSNCGSRL